jgi:uncharacterized membrane protein
MQIIVAAFNDEKTANEALKGLKQASRAGIIKIQDAAVLRRDAKNKLHIKETGDMGGGKGAVLGGVAGAVVGLLAGPVVLVGAAGALIGGLAAKLRDSGFSNQRLNQLGAALKPGSSAIVAVVEHTWVEAVQKELEKQATQVLTEQISADIAAQLEAGKDVAYSALAAQGGFEASRVAAGEDSVEAGRVVVTDEGVAATAVTADEETVELSGLVMTEEGLVAAETVLIAEEIEEGDEAEGKQEGVS